MKGKIASLLIVALFISSASLARRSDNGQRKSSGSTTLRTAANCSPAVRNTRLEFNNVSCIIETGGSMWQDRPNGAADYIIPAGGQQTSIYSGSLWMGGTDINGQLKIAAVTFRNGTNDFWTGPLSKGEAEIEPATCLQYDRFYEITRADVDRFIQWYECNLDETCTLDESFDGYSVPKIIQEWPAHGDESLGQDFYLAPFYDRNGDGFYDYEDGDYPYYDVTGDIDCRVVRDIRLFGDDTHWWVFNDKGNIHTETNGSAIGMEIRAQAFAFATNDAVNDMTFYNYELINRSTFTLTDTYFGQWVDPDLGNADDDYVGCDVERGLGFCYNGDGFDEDNRGAVGYGSNPPAIGIDFFEGPYQDDDGINNLYGIGPGEALNGIGYFDSTDAEPDTIIDNERYGMRRFVYYNRGNGPINDPVTAVDHYNYLRGIWRDGTKQLYGGNGNIASGSTELESDFMFPGNSDPLHWGTRGINPGFDWTEEQAGNPPFDRRFLQSAGPFTLLPGAVNDITVGVVWAQAASGDPFQSVLKLKEADEKAQALFDNCFNVLNGPDAPDLSGQELDQEIILYLSNKKGLSNNFRNTPEDYEEEDPFIVTPDEEPEPYDNKYRFQGYQIFQLKDATVSVNDIGNLELARPLFQCDIRDDVSKLVNFEFDDDLGANKGSIMVDGANQGIQHSFQVTEDLFSQGDPKLVNYKTYYYMAIAYGYNNFKTYIQDDPLFADGQKTPYISSRKSTSGSVQSFAFIPHPPESESGGTQVNAAYGDQPEIIRLEGVGNGGLALELTTQTVADIIESPTSSVDFPVYQQGAGPVEIKVIDPLNIPAGQLHIEFLDTNNLGEAHWKMWLEGSTDTVYSEKAIILGSSNEQLIRDWGISLNVTQAYNPAAELAINYGEDPLSENGFISATQVTSDISQNWLSGIADTDGQSDYNWIRAGTTQEEEAPDNLYNDYFTSLPARVPDPNDPNGTELVALDGNEVYEKILEGTWAPYRLCAYDDVGTAILNAPAPNILNGAAVSLAKLEHLQSVNIYFTADKTLWTRCPVLEMQKDPVLAIGGTQLLNSNQTTVTSTKHALRQSPSVDIDGNPQADQGVGMGWFPGFAINVETGQRLNMAFGEDSWLAGNNGADMLWNPTDIENQGANFENVWGGKHYIYVFNATTQIQDARFNMPAYDRGETLYSLLKDYPGSTAFNSDVRDMWTTCIWVGLPILAEDQTLLGSDVVVSLRVNKTYDFFQTEQNQNQGRPHYLVDLGAFQTKTGMTSTAESALDNINVVPNPYYAFSQYEGDGLTNTVKITNLPETCTISIYNIGGTLVRKFQKSDPNTFLDWNLKNTDNIPIASGVYIIHINADGVGEKIIKWFGVIRPVDLESF